MKGAQDPVGGLESQLKTSERQQQSHCKFCTKEMITLTLSKPGALSILGRACKDRGARRTQRCHQAVRQPWGVAESGLLMLLPR